MEKERSGVTEEDNSRLNNDNEDKSSVPQSSFGENKK